VKIGSAQSLRYSDQKKKNKYIASVEMSFITHAAAKILKKCNIRLLIMDSPGGYRPVTYIVRTQLNSTQIYRRADVKFY